MTLRPIQTSSAPQAVGPYSQGVAAGAMVFTSGQLPMTPTGEMVRGDIEAAARQALENLRAVLEAAGARLADVVKVTIYLVDIADFASVNRVYGEFFSAPYPARSCVAVARLPLDAELEIEAAATLP
jgi:2-iminobutanoate/2-iminopropanoate deaminase